MVEMEEAVTRGEEVIKNKLRIHEINRKGIQETGFLFSFVPQSSLAITMSFSAGSKHSFSVL